MRATNNNTMKVYPGEWFRQELLTSTFGISTEVAQHRR